MTHPGVVVPEPLERSWRDQRNTVVASGSFVNSVCSGNLFCHIFSHLNQFRPINDCRILSRQPVWIKHMNSIFFFFFFFFFFLKNIYCKSIKNDNLIDWFSLRVHITNSEYPDWHYVLLSDPRSCLSVPKQQKQKPIISLPGHKRFAEACLCSPTFRSTLCWATSARNVIDVCLLPLRRLPWSIEDRWVNSATILDRWG